MAASWGWPAPVGIRTDNRRRERFRVAELSKAVRAPGPERSIGPHGDGVTFPGGDLPPQRSAADADRHVAEVGGAVTELAIEVSSPGPQTAIGFHSGGVIMAGIHLRPIGIGADLPG